jgi:hypothetical protein
MTLITSGNYGDFFLDSYSWWVYKHMFSVELSAVNHSPFYWSVSNISIEGVSCGISEFGGKLFDGDDIRVKTPWKHYLPH